MLVQGWANLLKSEHEFMPFLPIDLGGELDKYANQDPPVGVSNELPHTTYRLPDRAP